MGRSKDNESMVLECKFGKLVCEVMRDDEDYREFAIDLIADDGKKYQVAVIGTNERGDDSDFNDDMVHVYAWNGRQEDCAADFYMDPHGDGYYCDQEEGAE